MHHAMREDFVVNQIETAGPTVVQVAASTIADRPIKKRLQCSQHNVALCNPDKARFPSPMQHVYR